MIDRRTLLGATAAAGLAAALPARLAAQPGRYQPRTPLPFSVQEIYPTLWRGRLVVGGGFRARGPEPVASLGALWPTAAVVWKAPGATAWEELPALPMRLHHPFLGVHGSALACVGGFTARVGAIWQMERRTFFLDSPDGRWVEGPPLPAPQAEVGGATIAGRLLIAGGRTPAGPANAQSADHRDTGETLWLKADRSGWERLAPLPQPRNHPAAAVLDGRLHLVAGRLVSPGAPVNQATHHVFDPATGRWSDAPLLPQPRGGHAAATLGAALCVFGGETFGERAMAHAEAFAFEGGRWRALAPMPGPRHGLGAVAARGGIHLLGGAAEAGGRATGPFHDRFSF